MMVSVFYFRFNEPTFSVNVFDSEYLYEGFKKHYGIRENASIWIVPGTLTADHFK